MKIVVSPAKSLDFETAVPTTDFTQGQFLKEAAQLNAVLKKKKPAELSKLMSISDKLGELNYQRNQAWQLPFELSNARQAVFAFKGDVYQGLDAYTLDTDKINKLQEKLRILSGQYGILKPLDLIQPYRLEMGTKLKFKSYKNLYDFWGESISSYLNSEMEDGELFVNLASNEYFKVVKPKLLKNEIITPVFKDYKNGNLKVISFFAKKARGLMVRYIIDNDIDTVEGIKNFDVDGYVFDANLSTEKELIFTR